MEEVEVLFALRSNGAKVTDISKKCNSLYTSELSFYEPPPPTVGKDNAIQFKNINSTMLVNKDINPEMKRRQAPFFYIDKNIPWTCCAWVKVKKTYSYGTLFNGGRARSYQRLSLFCSNTDPTHPNVNIVTDGGWPIAVCPTENIDMVNNWTHVAFVRHEPNRYSIYINGVRKYNGPVNRVDDWDFGSTKYVGIFIEAEGDGNSAMMGSLYDFTFIRGKALWDSESFTLPTDYVLNEYNIPVGTTIPPLVPPLGVKVY